MNPDYKWENDPLKDMFDMIRSPRIGHTYIDMRDGSFKRLTSNGWAAVGPVPIEEGKLMFRNDQRKYYQYTEGEWKEIDAPDGNVGVVDGEIFEDYKQRSDPDWTPYCFRLGCRKMVKRAYGFQCPTCANKIKHDMTHYDG
jgi:hypothetical protein